MMHIFSKETHTTSPFDSQTCWKSKKNLWLISDLNYTLKIELFGFDVSKIASDNVKQAGIFIWEYYKRGGRFNSAEIKDKEDFKHCRKLV